MNSDERLKKALDDQFAGVVTAHEFVGIVQRLTNWEPDGPSVRLEGSTGPVVNSDEREERLLNLHGRRAWATAPTWEDVDFLLSLLDSQAADKEFAVRTPIGIQIATDTATAMRDKCVEAIETMAADVEHGDALLSAKAVIAKIQSLTLDQVEGKQ